MSDASDLAAALLVADPVERARLLRATDAEVVEVALGTLGHQREPAAAEVLSLVDSVVDNRALKKVARRELHRLRSMGVHVPEAPVALAEPSPPRATQPVQVTEAWATDVDPSGSRAVWLLAERPLGGVWFAAALINDLRGLQDLSLVDTTRKRFLKDFETSRGDGSWITLPGDYALGLVREAVDLTRAQEGSLPTRYRPFRDVFGEAPAGPQRALVYGTISPVEANFNPGWLDESPGLLGESELAGWFVAVPPELRERARGPSSGLLVPGHSPEQQALQLVADAAGQAFTPAVRRAIRRRLEETAYVFLVTERLAAARRAVAAAHALEDDQLPAERHPLLRLLLASGLARLTGPEQVGSRRAAEILFELVERATQQQGRAAGNVETRPSGLILPR